jgi:hypothetical protein
LGPRLRPSPAAPLTAHCRWAQRLAQAASGAHGVADDQKGTRAATPQPIASSFSTPPWPSCPIIMGRALRSWSAPMAPGSTADRPRPDPPPPADCTSSVPASPATSSWCCRASLACWVSLSYFGLTVRPMSGGGNSGPNSFANTW